MSPKLTQTQTQKQVLAPYMQQSIEVLLLPLLDLYQAVELELQENPLLEMEEYTSDTTTQMSDEIKQRIERLRNNSQSYYDHAYDDEELEDRPLKRIETLEEKLLQQLRIEISNPLHLKIGEVIIGNIDDDGYLHISCEEIGQLAGVKDMDEIEKVLTIIHFFEPVGVASRNLKECLLVQTHERLKGTDNLPYQVIQNFLKELGQRKFAEIARKLRVSLEEIKESSRFISSLDPKPASNFRPMDANIYVKPDVFISHDEAGYHIQLNEDGIPNLRINTTYHKLLREDKLAPDEREFIREKLRNALLFIKSIEQRGQTVRDIAQYILDKQKNFFKHGHMSLVPMTLKDVAQSINRNESTISRAVNNKYIDTPRGLFPMKFFFSQAVGVLENRHPFSDQNHAVSNRSIKEEIKKLIEMEDKNSPLSDQELQTHFENKGMKIARRTISKYRQALKILPSHLRKE